ncbi:MAG TPA: amidohydrolase family protein [Gemmatimonadales bacterium]|nr:amidohydrolase family protein [Gemmatimonadales bacterium]
MDAARRWAGAVAVRNGRIVYVGPDTLPPGLAGPRTEIVDVAGMVLPGFQDAHVHPISAGVELGECHLTELTSARAILDSIRACAAADPASPWVRGAGWQLPLFPSANPSRTALDRVVPDRPAAIEAMDGHSLWVNSRGLELAGITRDTPDPPGGRIERDPRTGEPTGTLRESAMALVARILPERTEAELRAGLERALRQANAFGITSLFVATASEADLSAYTAADRAGELTVRVVAAAYPDPAMPDSILPRARAWRARYATPRVRPIAVKLFQDGVIEARTAALLAPYLDRSGDAGTPLFEQPALDRLAAGLDRDGFQIHVHAIGDRAVRMTLDAFRHARSANGARDARHAITHLQLVDPADISRFRGLGVVANFEALWANGDEYLTELTEPALGPARSRWLYPIASVVRSGAVVTGGSDWSVSSLDPLQAIETGITHRPPGDSGGRPWNPAERVDLPTMLALYTINAAYALHQERETGSIEVGKLADLVVLDRNLFELPPGRIHQARVTHTLLEGKTVYQRDPDRP